VDAVEPTAANGLIWEAEPGPLRRPILVAAFEGWNDAADAASFAARYLAKHGDAQRVASIDPEAHMDFQSRRPLVELADGVTRSIVWPTSAFWVARFAERDLVVLRGIEPSYRWRSFCAAVLDVYDATRCEMVVSFGALLADVPHTRKVRVTGLATDPEVVQRLALEPSHYEGPTGIVGVLHDACRGRGIPSVSLWAPVPHYIASPPNPPASAAILERFGALTGIALDLSRVHATVARWREQVNQVAADDDDIRRYVEQLEERYDDTPDDAPPPFRSLPTGDEIADEVEQFLREQGGGDRASGEDLDGD
jgi:predicted ATP-grasp superfamily ATP-dependent carboligase